MTTVVNKTIQAAGGDYTTYATAISFLPSSLVTADEQWNFKADGTFSFAVGLLVSVTTDATRFIDFDCQTSKGFASAASPVGRWDSSKGLNLVCTGYAETAWVVSTDTFKLHNHQVAQTGGGNRSAFSHNSNGSSNSLVESNIFESGDIGPNTRYGIIRNCLSIIRGSNGNPGWQFDYYVGGTVACLTVIRPTSFAPGGGGNDCGFLTASAVTIKDCVAMGFTAFSSGSFSGSNNATDLASISFGTSNQVLVPLSTATFVGVTDGARDFRIVTGSTLKNTGVTDTTTIPAAVDAYGTSRPQGSAWDIGFHEFVSAVAGAPFFQTSWPNPLGAVAIIALSSQLLGTPTPLRPQVPKPFSLTDWPNPLIAQQPNTYQPQGSWNAAHPFVPPPPAPFRLTDWPNPQAPQPAQQTYQQGSWNVTRVTIAGQPFRLSDWPNPQIGPQPAQTSPYGSFATLHPQVQKPFNQNDWPVPPGPLQPTQTQPLGRWSGYLPLVVIKPFNLNDWPVPYGAQQPDLTQPLGSPRPIRSVLPIPRRQLDWPNPRGPQPVMQTQPYGTARVTFTPPVPKPFSQTDWPVPRGPQHLRISMQTTIPIRVVCPTWATVPSSAASWNTVGAVTATWSGTTPVTASWTRVDDDPC